MKTLILNDDDRIAEVAASGRICYLAMVDAGGLPYVVPMNYAWHEGAFYFHSGPEGTKASILASRTDVCIALHRGEELVCQHPEVACSYSMVSTSIVCRGNVEEITAFDEKLKCLNIFMKHYIARDFKFGEPAVRNVKIWRVVPSQITCKSFGNSVKK